MPLGGSLTAADEVENIRLWINQGAKWDDWPRHFPCRSRHCNRTAALTPGAQLLGFQTAGSPQRFREKTPIRSTLSSAPNSMPKAFAPRPQADKIDPPAARLSRPDRPSADARRNRRFLDDNSPDAWENLIDRLLASPHYGERWGRHWLDVARYADSNGFEHDFDRPNAWRYRDYVIRAFNQDKPYNDFLREQIAGDELDRTSPTTA